jgi:hypothetical protein
MSYDISRKTIKKLRALEPGLDLYLRIKQTIRLSHIKARMYGCESNIELSDLAQLYLKSDRTCFHCKKQFPFRDLCTDHRIPLAKQGANSKENCVIACRWCNSRNSDHKPSPHTPLRRYIPATPEDSIIPIRSVSKLTGIDPGRLIIYVNLGWLPVLKGSDDEPATTGDAAIDFFLRYENREFSLPTYYIARGYDNGTIFQ